ncbi:MAG: HEAT repeat domain-containing protein, partial [Promethearchaeota archaeon]
MKTEKYLNKLNNEDPDEKISALIKLGEIKDEDSVSEIVKALDDENDSVREHAAICLGKIGE